MAQANSEFVYRLIKQQCWWSELFDTTTPQYLFYDSLLNRYRTGCRNTARNYKWEFTADELDRLRLEHPDLDKDFHALKKLKTTDKRGQR